MTGIVAAIGSAANGLAFSAGLYQTLPSGAVDLSPIAVSQQSSEFNTVNLTYEWTGYIKGLTTGSIQLGAACPYQEFYSVDFGSDIPFDWEGGGSSDCAIWTGATARSGYNSSNRTAYIANGTGAVTFPVISGTYYLVRVQWSTSLPRFVDLGFSSNTIYFAKSSFDFTINGSNAVSGQIFYNTQTNGF